MFSPRRTIQLKNGPIGKLRARNVLLSVYAEHASPEIVNEVNESQLSILHITCAVRTVCRRPMVPNEVVPSVRTFLGRFRGRRRRKKGINFKRFPAAKVSPPHRLYVDIRMTFLNNSQILFVGTLLRVVSPKYGKEVTERVATTFSVAFGTRVSYCIESCLWRALLVVCFG